MRAPAFRLFILLIAWCVGFQSTASAMGMRCAHGRAATMESSSAMPAGMHHAGMAMPMSAAASSAHEHHHMGGHSKPWPEAKAESGKVGCYCGCNCATVGCVGSGAGIASLTSSHIFAAPPPAFRLHEASPGLRAAHGLDLIRPPSKS